jgi:hypothetical protein
MFPNPVGPAAWLAEQLGRARRTVPMLYRSWSGSGMPGVAPKPIGTNARNPLNARLDGGSGNIKKLVKTKSPYGLLEQPGVDPLGGLYDQLIAMLTQDVSVPVPDVSGIYDSEIARLENLMARQEARTQANRVDVENMYDVLGENYEELAPLEEAAAEEAETEVGAIYDELKADVEGNFTRIAQEQADLFSQLGIQAAAPEVIGDQATIAQQAANAADELGAVNTQRYEDIGNIDRTYWREGAPLARLTGSNKSTDLLNQLNDYLAARSSDIFSLQGQKAAAQSQAAAQAASQEQQLQQQQTQMLWQIMQGQLEAQSQGQMTAQGFLSMLPPQVGARVAQAFRALERDPNIVMGRAEDTRHPVPGTFVPVTDEYWLNAVDQMAESGQIDPTTREYLLQFLRMYLAER